MKANHEHFQFSIIGNTGSHAFQIQISDIATKFVSSVTLLGITID